MNDVRKVLKRHAGQVRGIDSQTRIQGVREHIRAERRRRTTLAGVAGGLALATVTIGAIGFGGLDGPTTPPTLAGYRVPVTTDSLGYGFTYVEGHQATGKLTIKLSPSKKPRMIRFASKGAAEVTVGGLTHHPMRLRAGDFGQQWLIQPRQSGTVTVIGTDEVAAALYELSRTAAGVSKAGITYRRATANGAQLDLAHIGDLGQNRLSDTLPGGLQMESSLSVECTAEAAANLSVRVTISGRLVGQSSCATEGSTWDPGINGGGYFPHRRQAGPLEVVAELVDSQDRPASSPTARIMYAVYDNPADGDPGSPGKALEEYGNVWLSKQRFTKGAVRGSFEISVDARTPVILWAQSRGTGNGQTTMSVKGQALLSVPVGGGTRALLSDGSPRTRVEMRVSGSTPLGFTFTVYRLRG